MKRRNKHNLGRMFLVTKTPLYEKRLYMLLLKNIKRRAYTYSFEIKTPIIIRYANKSKET